MQPERTLLAWRRTSLSLLAVSSLFLRWVPHHGVLAMGMITMALLAVFGIGAGQWRRYRISAQGINDKRTPAAVAEVLALGLICAALGGVGVYVVLDL